MQSVIDNSFCLTFRRRSEIKTVDGRDTEQPIVIWFITTYRGYNIIWCYLSESGLLPPYLY